MTPAPKTRGREVWACLILLLLAACPRFYSLGSSGLWTDEAATWLLVRGSIAEMLEYLRADVHPPLYYLAMWAWIRLAGASEWSLRAVSALAGTATVPLLAWSVTRFRRGSLADLPGMTAGVLLALSPAHIHYSQEAKSYALLLLLEVASAGCLLRGLEGGGRGPWRWWAGSAVLAAAALQVHVTALFFLPALCLLLCLPGANRPWSQRLRGAVLVACAGLALLPWLLSAAWSSGHVRTAFAWSQAHVDTYFPWQPFATLVAYGPTSAPPLKNLIQVWSPWSADPSPSGWLGWPLLGCGLLLALWSAAARRRPRQALALAVLAAVPLAGLFAGSLLRPIYLVGRSDVMALPWLLAGAAWGVAALQEWRPWTGRIALASWVAVSLPSLVFLYGTDATSPDRALADAIRTRGGVDLFIATGDKLPTALYYLRGPGVPEGSPSLQVEAFPNELWEHPAWETASSYDPTALREEARAMARSLEGRGFWLLVRHPEAPEEALEQALHDGGRKAAARIVEGSESYPALLLFGESTE